MKKSILLGVLLLFILFQINAQQSAIKLGVGGLFVTSPNLRFEQALGERMSFQITGSYKIPSKLNISNSSTDDVAFSDGRLKGFAVIPEVRFYFGQNKAGTIEGFYLAPYLKFHRYGISTTADFDYTDPENQTYNLKPDLSVSMGTIGGGLQLGYHWILGEHFSLDWHFLGIGVDVHRFRAKADFTNSEVDLKDVARFLVDEYNANSDNPIELTEEDLESIPGGDQIKGSLPLTFPGLRAGISIGYAF